MSQTDALSNIAQWAVDLMETLGSPGAGLAIALENIFPPLPSEVILPLAGFTASRGSFSLIEVLIWTTLGSLLGALALYGLGYWLGSERLKKIVARIPLMKVSDVERSEAWFAKHGSSAVFFGRMLPIFRSLISIPAGVTHMRLWRFIVLTTAGSAIWNSIFVIAGFLLGENWHLVEEYANILQYVVIAIVLVVLISMVTMRIRSLRREKKQESSQ